MVLGLEGGYVGEQVGEGVVDCVRALLGEVVVLKNQAELHRLPVNQALEDINQTLNSHVSLNLSINQFNIQNCILYVQGVFTQFI